ncbi:hypothetical protein SALBM135S_07432 [Streptomyces alboniger]
MLDYFFTARPAATRRIWPVSRPPSPLHWNADNMATTRNETNRIAAPGKMPYAHRTETARFVY